MARVRPTSAAIAATPLEKLPAGVVAEAEELLYGPRVALKAWLCGSPAREALWRQGLEPTYLLGVVDKARPGDDICGSSFPRSPAEARFAWQLLAQVMWDAESFAPCEFIDSSSDDSGRALDRCKDLAKVRVPLQERIKSPRKPSRPKSPTHGTRPACAGPIQQLRRERAHCLPDYSIGQIEHVKSKTAQDIDHFGTPWEQNLKWRLEKQRRAFFSDRRRRHEEQLSREADSVLRNKLENAARARFAKTDLLDVVRSAAAVRQSVLEANKRKLFHQEDERRRRILEREERLHHIAEKTRNALLTEKSMGPPKLRAARQVAAWQAARIERIHAAGREVLQSHIEEKMRNASLSQERTRSPERRTPTIIDNHEKELAMTVLGCRGFCGGEDGRRSSRSDVGLASIQVNDSFRQSNPSVGSRLSGSRSYSRPRSACCLSTTISATSRSWQPILLVTRKGADDMPLPATTDLPLCQLPPTRWDVAKDIEVEDDHVPVRQNEEGFLSILSCGAPVPWDIPSPSFGEFRCTVPATPIANSDFYATALSSAEDKVVRFNLESQDMLREKIAFRTVKASESTSVHESAILGSLGETPQPEDDDHHILYDASIVRADVPNACVTLLHDVATPSRDCCIDSAPCCSLDYAASERDRVDSMLKEATRVAIGLSQMLRSHSSSASLVDKLDETCEENAVCTAPLVVERQFFLSTEHQTMTADIGQIPGCNFVFQNLGEDILVADVASVVEVEQISNLPCPNLLEPLREDFERQSIAARIFEKPHSMVHALLGRQEDEFDSQYPVNLEREKNSPEADVHTEFYTHSRQLDPMGANAAPIEEPIGCSRRCKTNSAMSRHPAGELVDELQSRLEQMDTGMLESTGLLAMGKNDESKFKEDIRNRSENGFTPSTRLTPLRDEISASMVEGSVTSEISEVVHANQALVELCQRLQSMTALDTMHESFPDWQIDPSPARLEEVRQLRIEAERKLKMSLGKPRHMMEECCI